jgi:serine protease Do
MTTGNVASDLAAVATSLRRITVRVQDERGRGAGSGVVWNDDGLVITNAHVATGRRAAIADAGGRSVRATVERRDPERDLAALRIVGGAAAGLDVAVATVRDWRSIRAGEVAVAVGNPLGLVGALTAGVVQRCNDRWVIADVRLAPGNSGGPLADSAGRVLGINSMIVGGLALAVPTNAVAAFLDGDRSRPRLGVALVAAEVARDGRRLPALLVTDVLAGSRAERAGLMLGDAIVAVDGRVLGASDPGTQLGAASTLEIVRGGERRLVPIELGGTTDGARAA